MPDAAIREDERVGVLRSLGLLDTAASEDFDQITRLAAYCFDAPIALISLVDTDRQQFLSRIGFAPRETPRDRSICAHAIHGRDILEIEDLRQDSRFRDNPLVRGEPHMRFYAGTPLITDSGHAIGALCIIDTRPRRLLPPDREQLRSLGRMVMDRVALRQSIGRRDAVSGLPNRHQMLADMATLPAFGPAGQQQFVLLDVLDLASAHEMAQAVGIAPVESLLRHAAQQALQVLPPHVALYHVGVTRFALWFSPAQAPDLLARLIARLQAPIAAAGIPIHLKVHAGVVAFDLADGMPPDLMRQSMTAVNAAISADTPLSFYAPEDDAKLRRRYLLALDLRHALERQEFYLMFQPRIDLRRCRVTSLEALIRWRHPQHGIVSPAEFIPIVERTALMQPLTLWVIDESLRSLAHWRRTHPHLRMSMNLSPRDLDDDALVPAILAACRRHDCAPAWLEFEVTEGEWLHSSDAVRQQMNALVEAGASLAIDDFGAGYSNFAYMNEIPAAVLKIDQSLIKSALDNDRHAILVREIMRLARRLQYRTVAEGVETEALYRFVSDCGCDEAQGYLFARPLDSTAVQTFLDGFDMPAPPCPPGHGPDLP